MPSSKNPIVCIIAFQASIFFFLQVMLTALQLKAGQKRKIILREKLNPIQY